MKAKTIAALVLTASTLLGAVSAEAGNKGGQHNQNYNNHYNKHRYYRPHFGFYVGGYDPVEECHYLKRKARHTGSHYWWRKYSHCVDRYSY
ncbi:MAG: hypothetical protein KDJ80_07870 [Nitratireductor sp.]|nr:hypothetical protein [Nitratireductor sp.]